MFWTLAVYPDMDPASADTPARITWEVIDRYLAGEATPAEVERVHARLQQFPGLEGVQELENHLGYLEVSRKAELSDRLSAWRALEVRITAEPPETRANPESLKGRILRWQYGAVAAIAVVLSVVVFGHRQRIAPQAPSITSLIYHTGGGQRATVTLPGGSQALLGPSTRLTTIQSVNDISAIVDGEASFTVAHDPQSPFVVRTKLSITRVLGTQFVVRYYPTDHAARVVVTEGRVVVHAVPINSQATGAYSVLPANTLALVTDSGQVKVVPRIDAGKYTAWTNGELVFESTPVRDVVADLGRAYGVEIRVPDSVLANLPIDWSVQTKRFSLAQVLPELLMVLKARAIESGRTITITAGRPPSLRSAPLSPSHKSESQYGR